MTRTNHCRQFYNKATIRNMYVLLILKEPQRANWSNSSFKRSSWSLLSLQPAERSNIFLSALLKEQASCFGFLQKISSYGLKENKELKEINSESLNLILQTKEQTSKPLMLWLWAFNPTMKRWENYILPLLTFLTHTPPRRGRMLILEFTHIREIVTMAITHTGKTISATGIVKVPEKFWEKVNQNN